MFNKLFKAKNVEKETKEVIALIELGKIEGTVPKVVSVVAKLRSDKAELQDEVTRLFQDADKAQEKIDELEAILASLLSEGGESAGGVV